MAGRRSLWLTGALCVLAALAVLPGCSSSSSSTTGRLLVEISWPTSRAATRATAGSVVLVVTQSGSEVTRSEVLLSNTTMYQFVGIPVGTVAVTMYAYRSTDGTGTAISTATKPGLSVTANANTDAGTFVLDGTVAQVSLMPSAPTVATGGTTALTAAAYDSSGNPVAVAAGDWTWSTSDSSVATVSGSSSDGTATVTGVAAGDCTITASTGGISDTSAVAVADLGSVKVTLSPAAAVSAGAMWTLDADSGHASGVTVSGVAVGTHTIAFKSATGYTAPDSTTVTVTKNTVTSYTATYTAGETGGITGTLERKTR